jgi:hypothetical protein
LILVLAFALTGCAGLGPAAPKPTAVVEIQTVLVTVVATEKPAEAPTQTPQIIVVTATPEVPSPTPVSSENAASPAASTAVSAPTTEATATLPANAGGDLFTNLTRSGDHFALRCQPDTLSFGVSTSNPYVVNVTFYYRIEDRLGTSISNWLDGGTMVSDKKGNFTIDFPSSRVDPDSRSHRAWLDYEFVGLNRLGDAVGRSAKIAKQVTFTIDCAD